MKTIFARINPDFKRAQQLPAILNLGPPTTGSAEQRFAEYTPTRIEPSWPMTDDVLDTTSVSHVLPSPAVPSPD